MTAIRLDQVLTFDINPTVISTTLYALQRFGELGYEGLVLWVGDISGGTAHITQAFLPDQQPIKGEDGVGYFVDSETLFQVNKGLAETGLCLIAQVHSHPGKAYHSEADDRYAIVTAEGGLSLVVPNFGRAPADPKSWAVYRLSKDHWRKLDQAEVGSIITIGALR